MVVAEGELVAAGQLLARVHDVVLVDHHALRRTGGARRVDQRGEVGGVGGRGERVEVGRSRPDSSSAYGATSSGMPSAGGSMTKIRRRRGSSSRTLRNRSRNPRPRRRRSPPRRGRRGTAAPPATTSCRSTPASPAGTWRRGRRRGTRAGCASSAPSAGRAAGRPPASPRRRAATCSRSCPYVVSSHPVGRRPCAAGRRPPALAAAVRRNARGSVSSPTTALMSAASAA